MHATEMEFAATETTHSAVEKTRDEASADASSDVSPSAVGATSAFTVALVDWSQLVEDYLDNIGVSFESFRDEMSGGWMFGYVDALRLAGVRTVLFCVSARVAETARFRHAPTGATLCVLPAPRAYRALRRRVLNPYAATVEEAVGRTGGARRAWWAAMKELSPYLSTPVFGLARELRRERCDALLVQDYEHGRFDACLALGRLTGRRVYATFQGGDRSHGRLERLTRRFAVRRADGVVVAARGEAERLRARYGLDAERIARVFNPLDLAEWRPGEREAARRALGIPAEARVVAWHGRVDFRRKGLDVLLEAWRRVCDERHGRDLRLLLVGTGNDADELRAATAGAHDLFWIDEYIKDRARLRLYLHAADAYAFPSRHEGFAVAPLEAMACGLPVVAADAPGIPDLLEGGEDAGGLLVPRGDSAAFAVALGRLLDDDTLRRTLGVRARARVAEGFALDAVGRQLREFLTKGGRAH